MFGVVPRVVWSRQVPSDEQGRIDLPLPLLRFLVGRFRGFLFLTLCKGDSFLRFFLRSNYFLDDLFLGYLLRANLVIAFRFDRNYRFLFRSGWRRFDFDRRFVRLKFDDRLALAESLAWLLQPAQHGRAHVRQRSVVARSAQALTARATGEHLARDRQQRRVLTRVVGARVRGVHAVIGRHDQQVL